jgi:hypothetical protein
MIGKRISTFLGFICVLVLVVGNPVTIVADDDDDYDGRNRFSKRCKLPGTWIGETPYPLPDGTPLDPTDDTYYMLRFFATYHGMGNNGGPSVTEWINPVPDPGTSWSNVRGVWEKSGFRKYEYTKIGHIFDSENGNIIFVVRHRGTITLTDCNTAEITSTIEYLSYPDMVSLMCVPADVTIHRVVMQDACQLDSLP